MVGTTIQHLILLESREFRRLRHGHRAERLHLAAKLRDEPGHETVKQAGRCETKGMIRQAFELRQILGDRTGLPEFE